MLFYTKQTYYLHILCSLQCLQSVHTMWCDVRRMCATCVLVGTAYIICTVHFLWLGSPIVFFFCVKTPNLRLTKEWKANFLLYIRFAIWNRIYTPRI